MSETAVNYEHPEDIIIALGASQKIALTAEIRRYLDADHMVLLHRGGKFIGAFVPVDEADSLEQGDDEYAPVSFEKKSLQDFGKSHFRSRAIYGRLNSNNKPPYGFLNAAAYKELYDLDESLFQAKQTATAQTPKTLRLLLQNADDITTIERKPRKAPYFQLGSDVLRVRAPNTDEKPTISCQSRALSANPAVSLGLAFEQSKGQPVAILDGSNKPYAVVEIVDSARREAMLGARARPAKEMAARP